MPRADIDVISDHIVEETAAARPIKATYYGIAGHDHEIEDFSTAGLEACRRMRESQLARVTALPPTSDEWDSLAVRVMTDSLQDDLAWFSEGEHFRDLNSIDSTLQNVRQAFDFMDRETPQGWEAVAQRLQLVPQGLEAYADRLEEARVRGLTVARRQVVDCMRQARAHGGKESFALALVPGVTDVVPGDAALHDRVAAGVVGLQAAFSQLADYLEAEYLTDAVLTDGVGEERYLLSARRFLGDDLDARETYEWGWSEVLRLRERMAAVAGEISPGASLPEAL